MKQSSLTTRIVRWLAFAATMWCPVLQPRDAGTLYQFEYAGSAGIRFLDSVLGDDGRAALEHARAIWDSLIPTAYAGEVVEVRASFRDLGTRLDQAESGFWYPAPTRPFTHFIKAL